jgi:hypothetical protein
VSSGVIGFEFALRLSLAYVFWTISLWLARSTAMPWLRYLEPYAFLAFCTHVLVFRATQPMFGHDLSAPYYPIYFTLQPVLGYLAAILVATAIAKYPVVLAPFNAGKHPQPRAGAVRSLHAWIAAGRPAPAVPAQ